MLISDFTYHLPEELIAQEPLENRGASRMLRVKRSLGTFSDDEFSNLPEILRGGDVLVVNDTKVFPARLFGLTETGAKIEIFLINEIGDDLWAALARPGRRLAAGKRIVFSDSLSAELIEKLDDGKVSVRFYYSGNFQKILSETGKTPLPPYIRRDSNSRDRDKDRYQTVYARKSGAIAAPTAGLHFTSEIIQSIEERGVKIVQITLHVGYGTFEPVRVDDLSQHSVIPERFYIGSASAEVLNKARDEGRRIISVGTTTTRVLETNILKHGKYAADTGYADLTIRPGHFFRAIDGLLTNFHLPQSSLLVLVSAFGGHGLIMNAYRHAVESRYRFYSYGDCMLIL